MEYGLRIHGHGGTPCFAVAATRRQGCTEGYGLRINGRGGTDGYGLRIQSRCGTDLQMATDYGLMVTAERMYGWLRITDNGGGGTDLRMATDYGFFIPVERNFANVSSTFAFSTADLFQFSSLFYFPLQFHNPRQY